MRPRIKAGTLALSAVFLLASGRAQADDGSVPLQAIPSETSVLLLPALDATKDAEHMQAPRQLVIKHWEQFEFITRHFKVLGDAMAAKAADAEPKIDLGKLSDRTPENLDAMAKRTGADLVVDVTIEAARMDAEAGGEYTIHTRVHMQIWDARHHAWVINGPYAGEIHGGGSPVFAFKDSLADALKSPLAKLLDAYPQVVTVSDENSLKDYLAGQTEPFLGDPNTTFGGLKIEP